MSEQLSKNFTRAEFACKCGCGFAAVDLSLVRGLQTMRDQIGAPIEILSGCRCPAHNTAVGGAPSSQHLLGKAADIRVNGMSAARLIDYAHGIPQFCGFGRDDQRQMVHVDTRLITARWCYQDGKPVPYTETA